MNRIAQELLRIAEEILPQTKLVFKRSKDAQEKEYNNIASEIQRFISTLRGNEELTSEVVRTDDDKTMTLTIGLSEHEAMSGIVRELEKMAKKLAKRAKLEFEAEDVQKSE
jgi:transcription initiation factor IIE alpha subunit